MEEVEQTAELETNSDETEGAASDASSKSAEGGEPASAAAPKTEPEPTPFHEHPRFKELVEQKNQALASQRALEQKLAQFEQRLSQPQTPAGPTKEQTDLEALASDLDKIDPRLAAQIRASAKAQEHIQSLTQRLEGFEKSTREQERDRMVRESVTRINSWHEQNKLSPESRNYLNAQIDNLYMQGKLNPENLESTYKQLHEGFNKFLDSIKRSERESYVADKKKDAQVPTSQPKGAPAKPAAKKPSWSKDPEVARQQIVSRFLKQQSANKEADSA